MKSELLGGPADGRVFDPPDINEVNLTLGDETGKTYIYFPDPGRARLYLYQGFKDYTGRMHFQSALAASYAAVVSHRRK